MKPQRSKPGPVVTLVVVVAVGAALVVENVRTHGPYLEQQWVRNFLVETYTRQRGWPLPYYERKDVILIEYWYYITKYKQPPTIQQPALDWRNGQSWLVAANAAVAMLMLAATALVVEYWRRQQTGPFQFGLRSLLVLTAVVALSCALIENDIMRVSALLAPPLALGLLSMPIVAGLALRYFTQRSDRRLRELRTRYAVGRTC